MVQQASLPVRIGVSRCLLGEAVRHDGGHKKDSFLVEALGPHVEWVGVCPEVEVGMGVPREPVQLVSGEGEGGRPRMVGVESGRDWTGEMESFAQSRLEAIEALELSGWVL